MRLAGVIDLRIDAAGAGVSMTTAWTLSNRAASRDLDRREWLGAHRRTKLLGALMTAHVSGGISARIKTNAVMTRLVPIPFS
jgi:hypothetical protein